MKVSRVPRFTQTWKRSKLIEGILKTEISSLNQTHSYKYDRERARAHIHSNGRERKFK